MSEIMLLPCPICNSKHVDCDGDDMIMCEKCGFECRTIDWKNIPRALTWTTEPPKVPGWYWKALAFSDAPACIVCFNVSDIEILKKVGEKPAIRYAGPIPLPMARGQGEGMSLLIDMITYRKGNENTFFPKAGQKCLFSGPNCDDENGYVFIEVEVLWSDDTFVITRIPGCWPIVNKWEHIICKDVTGFSCHSKLENALARAEEDKAVLVEALQGILDNDGTNGTYNAIKNNLYHEQAMSALTSVKGDV